MSKKPVVIENQTFWHGECLRLMDFIPDNSIDMVLCDLPYGTTACKWDVIIPFELLWEQYWRVLKPNGAVVLTASQPFTTKLIASQMKHFKYEWIWNKRASANFAVAKYQPLKVHENIVVFGGNYKPQMTTGKMRTKGGKVKAGESAGGLDAVSYKNDQYYPISLLDFKTQRGFHPTQKPVALFEYLIKTYTNEGETVLDNCSGSGTTAIAAHRTGRKSICIEQNEEYFIKSVERMRQTR